MKIDRSCWRLGVFVVLLALPAVLAAQVPKAHRHRGRFESVAAEVRPDFKFVETRLDKDAAIDRRVRNKSRTFEAFTIDESRLFVKDLKSGKIYEIRGLSFEWRFFADVVWADNRTLMFDRWTEPHYAIHYTVDVSRRRLLEAYPFPDEFMRRQLDKKQRGN
ncbi:MAG: hypothetical protein JSS81_07090 [Acidobacteria bacterium]|nr:hypothetical protein [Acidobacteriota bacterium]